jgi:16S rRNA (cytosine1402-N4)-methyltransferase
MILMTRIPFHIPVLRDEVIEHLAIGAGRNYIDATLGMGGHAASILERNGNGNLLGIDTDPAAVRLAGEVLSKYGDRAILVNSNYSNMSDLVEEHSFGPVHGIVFDLGISSVQLDTADRGFSFQKDAPLDMRFDTAQITTAADIIDNSSEAELASLLEKYGEEHHSRKIARSILARRPRTTLELAKVIEESFGGHRGKIHPATRTFQALRIAVNQELDRLINALEQTIDILAPNGRLTVISYHSLEDRIVKNFIRQEARGCICEPGLPVCQCGHSPSLKIINKKVIVPSLAEVALNPRSRSAKLRVAERLAVNAVVEDGN